MEYLLQIFEQSIWAHNHLILILPSSSLLKDRFTDVLDIFRAKNEFSTIIFCSYNLIIVSGDLGVIYMWAFIILFMLKTLLRVEHMEVDLPSSFGRLFNATGIKVDNSGNIYAYYMGVISRSGRTYYNVPQFGTLNEWLRNRIDYGGTEIYGDLLYYYSKSLDNVLVFSISNADRSLLDERKNTYDGYPLNKLTFDLLWVLTQ